MKDDIRHDGPSGRKSAEKFCAVALRAMAEVVDDHAAGRCIFNYLHPGSLAEICPRCGAALSLRVQTRLRQWGKCHCIECGGQFTAASGTRIARSKLSHGEILILAALVELGVPLEKIAAALGRDGGTVRAWNEKILTMEPRHG